MGRHGAAGTEPPARSRRHGAAGAPRSRRGGTHLRRPMGLRDEIREQPAAATRQLESSEGALEAIAARVRGEGITSVVIAAG